jgi:hypothetical protein
MTRFYTTLPPKLSKLPFKTSNIERSFLRSLRKAIKGNKFNERYLPKLRGFSIKLDTKGSTRYIYVFKEGVYFATIEYFKPIAFPDIRDINEN